MTSFVGIDLGTTFSAVATIDDTGRPTIVHNHDGLNITPSVVYFRDGVAEVGEDARKSLGINPNCLGRFKRDMGTSVIYKIDAGEFTPTQLSAIVLKKLASDATASIGKITEAVVTIPANFSHEAREATMGAAKAAGLNVKYIINEPTAAALYYAFKNGDELSGIYGVYDFGGGTFDISIIRVDGQNVEVLATNGVAKLGGDDFDSALQKLVQAKFKQLTGENLEPEDFTKYEAEEQKKSLSKRDKVSFQIRAARKNIVVTRKEFEEAISSYIAQAQMNCESAVDEAKIELKDIKGVLLVGGSTRVPAVRESVKRVFGQEPIGTVNVDEVVALGAALYAAYKGDKTKLTAVQRNSVEKIKVSESTSKCFGTISLGHDEARGEAKLMNSILIRKGEKIPCSVTESFYTIRDGQQGVDCMVTESIAPETDPRFVKIIWKGSLALPPNRPADQEIKVSFAYDENQIMKCSFVDVATGRETKIDLTMASGEHSAEEIEKFLVE